MKRKYFSALLMGTLTVASMGTFTSCKDYDDDISNLQGQIDKLATADQLSQKVAELQALISSNTSSIGTLQSALDEAKKAAEKAQTTADSKATLDQVNGILADYAKVSYVDDAKKSLNDAIEALKTGDITTLKADIEAAAKAAAAKADAETAIAEVKKDLEDKYVTNATYQSEKEAAEAALETLKNQVAANTGNIQANTDAIVKLQAIDVVTKADLVAKLGEYATAQQAKDLQKELTDLKNNFADEIAKYALKSDLNSLATKDELQKASEKAANDLQSKLNDYLKADVLASLATKDDIKDLQNKEAVQNLIKEAIQALKDGDIKSIGDKAAEALQKANKAESTEGLAYVKTLAAEGKAVAATADSKAEANKSEIATIKNILGDKFDAKNTVSAAIELINSQLTNDKTGLAALDGRLSSIESLLNQDTPDATSLKTRVDNIENKLKDIIGQYSTMVTDVQLFDFAPEAEPTGFDQKLNFIQATEQANVFPGAGVADAQFTFEKGKYFAGEDSLLIRVSPVDAELTTSNVSLLNSQGKELNDLIEVTDAHRYDKLLYASRAAGDEKINTGLWVVKFKAKDLGDDFKAAAEVEEGAILYSVAVKNTYTTDEAKDRRVTSEYKVTLGTDVAEHAYDFTVNGTSIKDIKNRRERYDQVQELDWIDNAKPATTVITTGNDANAGDRATDKDKRNSSAKILAVQKGGNIVIDFTKQIGLSEENQNKDFGVKGFYVTLDDKFALESGVSEINAWNSYTYENVGYKKNGTTYQPAKLFTGNKGTIKIEDTGAATGDVIGFRVYAVNYDGTLTDPDGRAFYVAIGDAKVDMTIPATTVSLDKSTANDNQPKFVSPKIKVDFSKCSDFDASDAYKWAVTAKDKSGADAQVSGNEFSVKYFKADGSETDKLSKEVTAIQFVLNKPNKFIDGETYTVSTTLTKNIDGAIADVSTVTASFKKEMPKEAPTFGYRDGFDKFEYIIPTDGYKVNEPGDDGKIANKGGKFDFRNILIINGNQNSYQGVELFTKGVFNFNVANGTYKYANNKYVLTDAKAEYVDDDNQYILEVNNGGANLVDNKTERTITANFVYKNISKKQVEEVVDGVKTKVWKDDVEYPVPSASSEKIVYCSWMKTFNVTCGNNWTGKAADKDKDGKEKPGTAIDPANIANWFVNPVAEHTEDLDLSKVDAKVADLQVLPSNYVNTVKGNNLTKFFQSGVIVPVKDYYGEVWTTSADGKQINPYFTAEFKYTHDTNTHELTKVEIALTQNNQPAVPSNVKGGLIHFTVRDCFGNLKAIQLPFVIKMPEVTARKH